MHYTYDIVNCILFISSLLILWMRKWDLSIRRRGVYGLWLISSIYLVSSVILQFQWHSETGEETIRPFFELDTAYFASITMIPAFILMYIIDICVKKPKHIWTVFVWPSIQTFYIVFLNVHLKWFFYYEDGLYHRGPLLWISYLMWVVYTVGTLYIIYRHRSKLGVNTVLSFVIFYVYEFLLQIYQAYRVNFYVGGVAFSTGLLFLLIAPLLLSPYRDELTNLYNRGGLEQMIKSMVLRKGENKNYQIIAVDIYNFKRINDRFGFRNGDKVLRKVAGFLTDYFPEKAEIARTDSDRFFVCCPRNSVVLPLPDLDVSESLPGNPEYTIMFFEGVYDIQEEDNDPGMMMDRAHFALESIKDNHHKKFAYFDNKAQDKLTLQRYILQEMHEALNEKSFEPHYQPIYSVEDRSVVAAEALAHWTDETYSYIPTGEYIETFENSGLIAQLDIHMMEQVCKNLDKWKKKGIAVIPISINLSRKDFMEPYFLDKFTATIRNHGISINEIRVEITENALIMNEEFRHKLEILHDLGCKLLIDDFGSGYSNLNVLADLPVDYIKLDMAFMENLKTTQRGEEIMTSIADMAERMGLAIIAEGVETEEQFAFLKEANIKYAQGYLLARPMPCEFFEKVLENGDV